MNDEQTVPKMESRRKGHRQSELLFSIKKTTIYVAVGSFLMCLSGVYYFGNERGYKQAIEAQEARTVALIEDGVGAEEIVDVEMKDKSLVVIRAAEDKAPNKAATSSLSATTAMALAKKTPKSKPQVRLDLRETRPKKGLFGIQLGAFKTRVEALAFVRKYRSKIAKMPIFLISVSLKKRGVWTRVRVGQFRTRSLATKVKKGFGGALTKGSIVVNYR